MAHSRQTNGCILRITPGRVNLPVVEDIVNEKFLETSIFGTQYRQMLELLDSYVKYRGVGADDDAGVRTDSPNNVFTFVGERGSGKTSCMASISKLLTKEGMGALMGYKNLSKVQFATIDIIDPSYFDEEHNIVAMMVAKLYKSFSEYDNEDLSGRCDRDCRNDLIEAFVRTQRSMRCLLDKGDVREVYESDDIENLSDLSVAIDLKSDIRRLVRTFLRFVKKENGLLVLSIDDIDLNVGEADIMAEQIRKYLVCPNIVILLATKLDQLATVKNLHYAEEFRPLLEIQKMDYSTIEDMTSQFLTKFSPHDQRVYMPTTEVYLNSGIEIDDDRWYGDSVMQVVPELIFNRTRYLFYSSRQTPSYIIPRNLRKLCQLVALLWPMETYHDADQEANKLAFKNYMFGTWKLDNLSHSDRKLANRLLDGWKNGQLNRIALDVIREKYAVWIDGILAESDNNFNKSDLKTELKALFDGRNREFNLAVGDVLSMVDVLEVYFESHADKCLFFFIKTIYSMALYESYDIVTEKQDRGLPSVSQEADGEEKNQVLLYDPFAEENIEAYHKLVGGRFYNYRLSPVLAKERIRDQVGDQVSRSDRMINYAGLESEMTRVVEVWSRVADGGGGLTDEEMKMLRRRIRLCEFFMLCCSRDINLRNNSRKDSDYYDHTFRQNETVYYNGDFVGKERLYFDLGAFFFNITRMDECYSRFREVGKDFCRLCQNDSGGLSLYSVFRQRALVYRRDYANPHAWQSWASIRNAEIMSDLNQFLRSKCRLKISGNQRHLAAFFYALSGYTIKTYDRDERGAKLNVNFEFASEIAGLLDSVAVGKTFDDIFTAYVSDSKMSNESIPQIDVDRLLKRRKQSGNKKNSVRNYLLKNECKDIVEFKIYVDILLGQYGDTMTKEEIRNLGYGLNVMLYNKYGNSKRNAEDTVSQAESADDSGSVEPES